MNRYLSGIRPEIGQENCRCFQYIRTGNALFMIRILSKGSLLMQKDHRLHKRIC